MKYILEKKEEQPQETDAIGSFLSEIAVNAKVIFTLLPKYCETKTLFNSFWIKNAANRDHWCNNFICRNFIDYYY
jgi:hypothetical protein